MMRARNYYQLQSWATMVRIRRKTLSTLQVVVKIVLFEVYHGFHTIVCYGNAGGQYRNRYCNKFSYN